MQKEIPDFGARKMPFFYPRAITVLPWINKFKIHSAPKNIDPGQINLLLLLKKWH